jgi:single-stranded DNA-binding protein
MADVIIQTLRVQDDAEIRDVAGKQVARVRASKSQGKDKSGEWRPSIWFDVESWSSNPWSYKDLSALRKGQYIVVQGRLSMREYDGKEGKVQAYTIDADRIDVLAERQQQSQQSGRSYSSDGGANRSRGGYGHTGNTSAPQYGAGGGQSPIGWDEDIPFRAPMPTP